MLIFLTIAGGVALILFGVRFLRKGLDRLFGPRLGTMMQRMAGHRVKAFGTGLGVSLIAPSSTTLSALAVSMVQAGHLSARQMFAVMLGADIGLTVMVLLISLHVDQYAPVLILVGVILFQFTTGQRSRGIGQTILSLGFVFLGVGLIKTTAGAVQGSDDLMQLVELAGRYPLLLALLAAVLAIALQSSTATIALVIALGAAGQITLPIGVAVVCGANIGIALTTLMLGWKQVASRRLALANLLGKSVVATMVLLLLSHVAGWLDLLPGGLGNKVAYAHTGFNILLACLCLPLVDPITRLVEKCIPNPPATQAPVFGPRHIHNGYFDSTALAIGQSLKEILHVGEIVRHMLGELWRAIETNNLTLARSIGEMDDKVDLLDREIKRFLTRVIDMEGDSSDAAEQMRQLRYLAELEAIGDIIDKNLSELVIKKIQSKADFSAQGWEELRDFYQKVAENLLIAETAFTTRDQLLARRLLNHKQKLRDLDRELRDRHFLRLRQGLRESHETSAIHLDLLTYLKRINSHVSHVAYATLTDEQS